MTLDNMTGITKGSYTGFCKSQLITCNRVKECNGVCPFEDALKHADKEMNDQTVIDHDRDWIIGCIEHDGFIHTHRFDKANQIIHDALSADAVQGWIPCEEEMPIDSEEVIASVYWTEYGDSIIAYGHYSARFDKWRLYSDMEGELIKGYEVTAWMPLPKPYREDNE